MSRRRPTGMRFAWSTPVDALPGVGPVRRRQLESAGLATLGDLLLHLPRSYQDRRSPVPVSRVLARRPEERPGEAPVGNSGTGEVGEEGTREVTLEGRLSGLRVVRTRRPGLTLVRGRLEDDTGTLPVVWFSRPYLARQIPDGARVLLCGKLRATGRGAELLNPAVERLEDADGKTAGEETASGDPSTEGTVAGKRALVPVYPSAGSCGPAWMATLVGRALEHFDPRRELSDSLPAELLARHELPPLGEALRRLHRPPEDAVAAAYLAGDSPAHRRLVYGELLELQLRIERARARRATVRKGFEVRLDNRVREVCRRLLPFSLTRAQRRVLREIVGDLTGARPMLRLLQGDVGSGKTIVAALALAVALENGLQTALLAPTETLAEQHFNRLEGLFAGRYRLGCLTGSAEDRGRLEDDLACGRLQLAVGTHALFQRGVCFHRLGLAVIDEQHRFGVEQRRRLQAKGLVGGLHPDVLLMTATPIPRSLALTVHGDLDLSVLDELPPGRTPVATEVVSARDRRSVYRRLARELESGDGRAYVVFPLIEDSDRVVAEALEARGEEVRGRLADVPSAIVHGRLPRERREAALHAFATGEVRLLIATSVIEVGLDVPEASVMVIESAERFGLAQLHQLRGRVGRSTRVSRCVAIHGRLSDDAQRRLEVFARTCDGFEIAEADLELRGPGELLGTRQAGLPGFRAADLRRHQDWLEHAREDAREVLPRLGEPRYEPLRRRLERRTPQAETEGWMTESWTI